MKPDVSLVIVNYKGYEVTKKCLDSIDKTVLNKNYEVIVVDSASGDDSVERLEKAFSKNRNIRYIVRKSNDFLTAAYNTGLLYTRGSIVVFMNNDLVFKKPWLEKLMSLFDDREVGLAGLTVVNANNNLVENTGGKLNCLGYGININQGNKYSQNNSLLTVDYIPGTLIVGRTELIRFIGGFDEVYGGNYEDVDLSLRLKKLGYRAVTTQDAFVYHLGSWSVIRYLKDTRSAYLCRRNRLLTMLKNYPVGKFLVVLPGYLVFQLIIIVKEIFIDRQLKLALTTPQALLWVFKNYPKLYPNIK